MPDTASLLTAAGAVGILAILLVAAALLIKRGKDGPLLRARALLLAGAVCALCGVAIAIVAGTLLVGTDLGWF